MNTLKISNTLINLDYYYLAEAHTGKDWRNQEPFLVIKLVPIIGVETDIVDLYIEDYPENWKEIIEAQLNKMDSVR